MRLVFDPICALTIRMRLSGRQSALERKLEFANWHDRPVMAEMSFESK